MDVEWWQCGCYWWFGGCYWWFGVYSGGCGGVMNCVGSGWCMGWNSGFIKM